MSSPSSCFYLGIDVGTGSARAGIFDSSGKLLGAAAQEIQTWKPQADFVQQSSENIWQAVCSAVRSAVKQARTAPKQIKGIGFDATCSLVVLDEEDRPLSISPDGDDEQNVMVWMDHRAVKQADYINHTQHEVLKYVGGVISPEMQTPKLLWLKQNMAGTWRRAKKFFDLPDFLVFRATGWDTRSLCSTVCKWTYLGHEKADNENSVGSWDESYFRVVGLGDLADEKFKRIGPVVRPLGEPVGSGLSSAAAMDLGLLPGTAVGVSIIDAHAGGIGMLGAKAGGQTLEEKTYRQRLALIGGTSSCHMAVSKKPTFVPGVWGPYYSAMVPGLWLNEGGQSATGALIDHVIFSHARSIQLQNEAQKQGKTIYEKLNDILNELSQGQPFPAALTKDLHVLPYFHGNRSPRADPTLHGMISGLTLDNSTRSLALLYLATIQAVAHGTKHIVDTLNEQGYAIKHIFACGGGTKNSVFLREHADITGCEIILPKEPEAVLLGSAILGAVASQDFADLTSAMNAMSHSGKIIEPASGAVASYHGNKHKVFLQMYEDQMHYRTMMG